MAGISKMGKPDHFESQQSLKRDCPQFSILILSEFKSILIKFYSFWNDQKTYGRSEAS